MKYESQINEMFKHILKAENLTESEFKNYRDALLKASNSSMEIMSEQIEIGVKNGHSVEFQLGLIKTLL